MPAKALLLVFLFYAVIAVTMELYITGYPQTECDSTCSSDDSTLWCCRKYGKGDGYCDFGKAYCVY